MAAITTEMTIFNPKHKHGVLSDDALRIKMVDEGGGFFLHIEQFEDILRLDFSEWDELVDAVRYIRAQYEMQGLL